MWSATWRLHSALNQLGQLLRDTNRLAEAEALFRRALATDEQRWGPIDQHVFTDLINLGGLLLDARRLAEAEPILRRALTLAEGYGPNYEQARALNSLGALLREMNRPAEAEALFRRALPLDGELRIRSPCCHDARQPGGLLQDTNRLGEAEALYRRALAIHEKSFGPDHPNVAVPLNNLATLLHLAKRLRRSRAALSPGARHRREDVRTRSSQSRSSASSTWPTCCTTPSGGPRPSR